MNAKGLLYFLAGGALGFGLTFLLLKEKYKNETEEAIEDVKAYYKKLEEEAKKEDSKEEIVDKKEETKKVIDATILAKSVGADAPSNYTANTYTKLYSNEAEEDLYDENEDDGTLYPDEVASNPYIIDEAAFVNEKSYYDKIGLFYYEQENLVANEDYEIVDNWADLIGPDIGARFKLVDKHDEPFNYIYIRNDSIGADYEICLKKEAFN